MKQLRPSQIAVQIANVIKYGDWLIAELPIRLDERQQVLMVLLEHFVGPLDEGDEQ